MSASFDSATGVVSSGGTDTATVSLTVGANSDRISYVSVRGPVARSYTVTRDSQNYTLIDTVTFNFGALKLEVYGLVAPNTGVNNVSVVADTTATFLVQAGSWYDAKQSIDALDLIPDDDSPGTVTSHTHNLTTTIDNSWTALFVSAASPVASTGSTVRGTSGNIGIFDSNGPKTPAGATSMTVTCASGAFGSVILQIPPAPAAGTEFISVAGSSTPTGDVTDLTPVAGQTEDVGLYPSIQYQTMLGWEVTAQAGDDNVNFSLWQDEVMALAAEYGVDAIRVEIKDDWETSDGVYDWTDFDNKATDVLLPLKAAVEAVGRTLHVNMCYVAFGTHSGLHTDPDDFADFVLACVERLDVTHGVDLDTFEVILEPDNATFMSSGSGPIVGTHTSAAGNLLAANGYTPDFIVPSTVNMGNAVTFYNNAKAQDDAADYIAILSYHRYVGTSDANLAAIKAAAEADGLQTAMLEWIGSTVETLWSDITKANVSLWQQYTLAYPTTDNGAQLFPIVSNAPTIGSRTYGLGQYFKYVRRGAVRIYANSLDGNVRPVAFINPGGDYVVVLHIDAAGTYTIEGLPAGNYYVSNATATGDLADIGDITVAGDGIASVTVASAQVVTISLVEVGDSISVAGSSTPTGDITSLTIGLSDGLLEGSSTPTGSLSLQVSSPFVALGLAGFSEPVGSVGLKPLLRFVGTSTPVGTLSLQTIGTDTISLAGSSTPTGELFLQTPGSGGGGSNDTLNIWWTTRRRRR